MSPLVCKSACTARVIGNKASSSQPSKSQGARVAYATNKLFFFLGKRITNDYLPCYLGR